MDAKDDKATKSTTTQVATKCIGYSDTPIQSTQKEKDRSGRKSGHGQVTLCTDAKQEQKSCSETAISNNVADSSQIIDSSVADTLVTQMKARESFDVKAQASNSSDTLVNPKAYLLKHERYHKNTRSLPQMPHFPESFPKKHLENSDSPIEHKPVLPRSPCTVDVWRQKPEVRNMLMSDPHRIKINRLLHSRSSPDLRKQRSASQSHTDYEQPLLLRHDAGVSCTSSTSTSTKRTTVVRGNGIQLIGGKTIGEIIHANPLLRREGYAQGTTPWRTLQNTFILYLQCIQQLDHHT